MPTFKEMLYLGRDFWRVARGRDYFHLPQPLGAFFTDPRCYYNDMTGKADWTGTCIEGVPALYIPAWGRHITFPVMVLQYGLGCLDRFFLTGSSTEREKAERVARWILRNQLPDGSFDNYIKERDPHLSLYSNNGAMVQGEALSFCIRAIRHQVVEDAVARDLEICQQQILANMLRPLEEGGTVLRDGDDVWLCEYCRTDGHVVLNGWIFAMFGLFDSREYAADGPSVAGILDASLATLERCLPSYLLPHGWSFYDNKGRICSPFYQKLHVSLLDAVFRLTGRPAFEQAMIRLARADHPLNRARYTARKVFDRLTDRGTHVSERQ